MIVSYCPLSSSTDASVNMLCREFPTVRLILLEENQGFADGYNMALQEVDAEYVVLLNSDVEVTEDWLQPLADYMDAHPEAAACQPNDRKFKTKHIHRCICRTIISNIYRHSVRLGKAHHRRKKRTEHIAPVPV